MMVLDYKWQHTSGTKNAIAFVVFDVYYLATEKRNNTLER